MQWFFNEQSISLNNIKHFLESYAWDRVVMSQRLTEHQLSTYFFLWHSFLGSS